MAPSSSISLEALDRLPSLSLSRCRWTGLGEPSGRHLGTRKHDRPRPAWASISQASLIGAEQNHLWPVSTHPPSPGTALVVLARTSEPPCFSVMPIPARAPRLSHTGAERPS